MTERLRVYEVGLRDGLQNERAPIAAADKRRLLAALIAAGVRDLELTSFVSPRAVPQLADAPELAAAAAGMPARAAALVVNDKGYDRAIAGGVRRIAIVVVVTDELCRRNNRMTPGDALATAERLIARAGADGVWRRAYVAPAFVCPYEGDVPQARVLEAGERLAAAGADELAIADTLGHAEPRQVGRMFRELARRLGAQRLAAHLHDTQAMGLACAAAAIDAGVRTIDASVGGLGGCPFAPGAAGNLATEDLVLMAHKMGFDTGIDLAGLWQAVRIAEELVGRPLGGRSRAWWDAQEARV